MDAMDTARKLTALARRDLEAADAYEQAMRQLEEPVIRERLSRYRQDHLERFQRLSNVIVDLGAEIPRRLPDAGQEVPQTRDLGDRSANGAEAVLKLLYKEETGTRQVYQEAARWGLSLKARALVDNGCENETHHTRFLEEAIKDIVSGR